MIIYTRLIALFKIKYFRNNFKEHLLYDIHYDSRLKFRRKEIKNVFLEDCEKKCICVKILYISFHFNFLEKKFKWLKTFLVVIKIFLPINVLNWK